MGKDPHQIRCRILPVIWSRVQFEKGRGNITIYAKQLNEKNFIQGIGVDREDVVHNWWWLVDHVFSKGDAAREQYMSQTRCPSFHEYWAERDALNGVFEELDQEGFQRAQRKPTRAELKVHPGLVILAKDGIETLLPGVDYTALKSIKYRAFGRSVLEANLARSITLAEMQLLWDATVHKVFRFECACAKESKANESMGIDGFSQAQYDQLVQDVNSGVPPPRPSLVISLPLPPTEVPRKRKALGRGSEPDSDDTGVDEDGSPTAGRERRRSKRKHRSGPGDEYGVLGYPPFPSTGRGAPKPRSQLPPLPSIFTAPFMASDLALRPEYEWLDPQLLSQSSAHEMLNAVGNRPAISTVLGPRETDDTIADSQHKDDAEDETGKESM